MEYRIGIDVGGTNTDAVIVDENLQLIESVKIPTTNDVTSGILEAMAKVVEKSKVDRGKIKYAMLGTTHATNAIVERKRLCKTAIIRIGYPATEAIMPLVGWPEDLVEAIGSYYYLIEGGHEFDGRQINDLNENELRKIASDIKDKVESIAIISVFSPVNNQHELKAQEIIREILGPIPISLSHEIGSLGLIERENATILNATLVDVAKTIANSFKEALNREGIINAKIFLCQNDGTLMSREYAMRYPILTIACGPTNSIRGAAFLSNFDNAMVLDVGGTTSDVGILNQGFPRESSIAVEIGGVRTNFRMPDLISIGLGGGTIIREDNGEIKIGPNSVGYRITEEALVFGGKTITATDIIVRLGLADIGDRDKVKDLPLEFAEKAYIKMQNMIEDAIDKIKTTKQPQPLILVGGGSILVGDKINGASQIIRPQSFGVANALGAAIAQVSGEVDRIYSLSNMSREDALADAKKIATAEAIKAGADEKSVDIVYVEEVPLAYLPGNAVRIRVKAVGDLL
ncbi:hydantoinase/oxoprolinase N-terminal domain-containing protein [Thermoanaerobacterium thermosaccharolyticum]|uniref:hydantoinase/oxoprolinase N-terminal domain-containing protein n=1 Tax=Thermoanaerobacterium thermosaccharolyticum TaxID=1517 RepID=UPI00178760AF|nr:hydantoinase/oxoprolinase family protein [Thermoanaerobacterium thermosaccharolyticum]MBE0069779.1 hydantoinase/oxoprolinase family protein [Thermoanaerobacterium thermosaccharolyticum]MBE0229506.1 hydantoinase/oxoprolinase family protein [Thermoanaerobacterium thermosaccharolyticum]